MDIGILQALADNLNVTLDFFATGDTNKNSIEEEEIISLYKKLDAYGKEAVRLIAKAELERVKAQAQSGQAPSAEADKKPVDPPKL